MIIKTTYKPLICHCYTFSKRKMVRDNAQILHTMVENMDKRENKGKKDMMMK